MERTPKLSMDDLLKKLFSVIAICMSLYHLYAVIRPTFSAEQHSNIHLGFALVLVYLSSMLKRQKKALRWVDLLFIIGAIISALYIHFNYLRLVTKVGVVNQSDKIIGVLLLVVVIEGSRRTFGNVLPALVVGGLLYVRYGAIFPGFFHHAGFKWTRVVATMTTNLTGIFGSILDISATYIVLFMIFGGLLESSGAGQFFIKLALAIGGSMRSGPAQAAIFSSGLVGSINGSAVANVATTGVFTIPLMKKCGYKSEMAGALESVASTGGMIMPPIMGVGAFVMSGITGIPYTTIALGGLIPALLYYATASITAHLYALKNGFQPMAKEDVPLLSETLKEGGHFLIPMAVVIVLMIRGISVTRAGFYGILSIILVVAVRETLRNKTYLFSSAFLKFLCEGLISGAKSAIMVAPSCAVMGILSQSVIMSGLAFKIVFFIKSISGGYRFLAVLLTMAISIFFGMGVPTTASYTLVAVIGASALTELGFSLLSVHMFIYYYAILANITPPVCAAVLVGSQIAGSDYMKTGLTAVRIGLPGFLLPFIFLYNPELLMQGQLGLILSSSLSALAGVFALVVAFEGYWLKRLSMVQRILSGAASLVLIIPGTTTDVIGAVLLALLFLWQKYEKRHLRAA